MRGDRSTGERPKVADADMVERVARAICRTEWGDNDGLAAFDWDGYIPLARAAIAAMREPARALTSRLASVLALAEWSATEGDGAGPLRADRMPLYRHQRAAAMICAELDAMLTEASIDWASPTPPLASSDERA